MPTQRIGGQAKWSSHSLFCVLCVFSLHNQQRFAPLYVVLLLVALRGGRCTLELLTSVPACAL
jgi:hypothetical protein